MVSNRTELDLQSVDSFLWHTDLRSNGYLFQHKIVKGHVDANGDTRLDLIKLLSLWWRRNFTCNDERYDSMLDAVAICL
jgi:hypothetical protein